jgi:TRAP-type transport system periplasmic protein
MPRLADGSINAVLSSGDGGAGRKLWEYLPHFTEITYSLPLSVASVNQAVYDGLDPNLRETVDAAGRQTETELWLALSTFWPKLTTCFLVCRVSLPAFWRSVLFSSLF